MAEDEECGDGMAQPLPDVRRSTEALSGKVGFS